MEKNNTISIFVSSTFRDMNYERDVIHNVIQRIEGKLLNQNINLRIVDLRAGGINNEKSSTGISMEEAVLLLCLESIDDCKPRFICLLGDRYGWRANVDKGSSISEEERSNMKKRISEKLQFLTNNLFRKIDYSEIIDRSITEIEVIYALKPIEDSKSHKEDMFFFFRDIVTNNEADLNSYRKNENYFNENERQDKLKNYILREMCDKEADRSKNIAHYSANYNSEMKKIDGELRIDTKEGSISFEEYLERILLENIQKDIQNEEPSLADLFIDFSKKKGKKKAQFKETGEVIEYIKQRFQSTKPVEADNWLIHFEGEAGTGKSTLLSEIFLQLHGAIEGRKENEDQDMIVIPFFAGMSSNTSNLKALLLHYTNELINSLGDSVEKIDSKENMEDINRIFVSFLIKAASQRKVILILDGIDGLTGDPKLIENFKWLHAEEIPKENFLFISTSLLNKSRITKEELKRQVRTFSGFDSREQIQNALRDLAKTHHGKNWDETVLELAVNKVMSIKEKNDRNPECITPLPLYIQILTSEVMNVNEETFTAYQEDESGYLKWMQGKINKLPGKIEECYSSMIKNLYNHYERKLVDTILGAIYNSRHGIFESDLKRLIEKNLLRSGECIELYEIKSLLKGHLRLSFGEGWWDFGHQQLRRNLDVKKDWITPLQLLHRLMISREILNRKERNDDYKNNEFLWHCYCGGVYEETCHFISAEYERDQIDEIEDTFRYLFESKGLPGELWAEELVRLLSMEINDAISLFCGAWLARLLGKWYEETENGRAYEAYNKAKQIVESAFALNRYGYEEQFDKIVNIGEIYLSACLRASFLLGKGEVDVNKWRAHDYGALIFYRDNINNSPIGLAKLYNNLATSFQKQRAYSEASEFITEAFKVIQGNETDIDYFPQLCVTDEDKLYYTQFINTRATIQENMGKENENILREAKSSYKLCRDLRNTLHDTARDPVILDQIKRKRYNVELNIGKICHTLREYEEALEALSWAADSMFDLKKNHIAVSATDEAELLLRKARVLISQKEPGYFKIVETLLFSGIDILQNSGKNEKEFANTAKDKFLKELLDMYMQEKEYYEVIQKFDEAQRINFYSDPERLKTSRYVYEAIWVMSYRAHAYLACGKEEEFKGSMKLLSQMFRISKRKTSEFKLMEELKEIYENMK